MKSATPIDIKIKTDFLVSVSYKLEWVKRFEYPISSCLSSSKLSMTLNGVVTDTVYTGFGEVSLRYLAFLGLIILIEKPAEVTLVFDRTFNCLVHHAM